MLHLRFRQLAFAALTGLVVIPLAWAPRQATAMHSSPSDLVQPHIMRELSADEAKAPTTVLLPPSPTPVVPLAPRTPNGPQREVFGFVQASVMGDAGVGYPSWDFSMLTTVAYFGVHINWDGHLVTNDNGWSWWNSGTLTNLVNAAHGHAYGQLSIDRQLQRLGSRSGRILQPPRAGAIRGFVLRDGLRHGVLQLGFLLLGVLPGPNRAGGRLPSLQRHKDRDRIHGH